VGNVKVVTKCRLLLDMNLVPMLQTQAFRKNIKKVSTDKQKLLMTFFVQCTIYMVRMLIRWHLGYFLLRHIGH